MQCSIESLLRTVLAADPDYVAAPAEPLRDHHLHLLFHQHGLTWNPPKVPQRLDSVRVDDTVLDYAGSKRVLRTAVHFSGRVPLYADRNPGLGLERITAADGRANLQRAVENPTPWLANPTGTVAVADLVDELVEAGASSIGVDRATLVQSGGTVLPLEVRLAPATGAPIVNQYRAVTVGSRRMGIDAIFTTDGPAFGGQIPVYAGDYLPGTPPIPTDMGLRELTAVVGTASHWDVHPWYQC